MPKRFKNPYLCINMAMSVDGKISSASGESCTFTSVEDKKMLVQIRSLGDAIIVGGHTARDYTTMGIASEKLIRERVRRGQKPQPIRVIVSGKLRLSPHYSLFKARDLSPIIIACTTKAPRSRMKLFSKFARVIPFGNNEVNVQKLVRFLVNEYGVKKIVSEGGPTLNDAFFRAHLVDDLFVTVCPNIVGGKNVLTISEGVGIPRLKNCNQGKVVSIRKGEKEWFLHLAFDKN